VTDCKSESAFLAAVHGAVVGYYEAFVERMRLDESASPSFYQVGAAQLIEELYGAATRDELESTLVISLGCGNPVNSVDLVSGEVVLDLGCGPGLDCILAGKAVGRTGRAIGIDLVRGMVDKAHATASRGGQTRVDFMQAAMENIPLRSGSLDVVISNCAVSLSANKGAVLGEVARVLRSGGRVAIYDILSDDILPGKLRSDLGRWAGCVSGVLTAHRYLELLGEARLTQARVREVSPADGFVERVAGAPRLYVGEITARR
jgi:ubiquinone/menaquinone biosynthesis C-methylase UbiE